VDWAVKRVGLAGWIGWIGWIGLKLVGSSLQWLLLTAVRTPRYYGGIALLLRSWTCSERGEIQPSSRCAKEWFIRGEGISHC